MTITNIKHIPSPKGMPLIGNALQIDKKVFHIQFEKWAEEYGPLYKVTVFGKNIYVISDYQSILKILNNRPNVFKRREIIEEVAEDLQINGVFTSEGKLWKQQRKLVNEAFKTDNLKGFYPIIKQTSTRLLDELSNKTNKYIDLSHFIDSWALDVSTMLMFNYDLNSIKDNDSKLYNYFNKVFPIFSERIMPGAFPFWKYFKRSKDREIDRIMEEFKALFIPMIQEYREKINSNERKDEIPSNLLEGMIRARGENHYKFNNDDVFANVFSLLLAGKDAITISSSWAIYHLTQHPEIQKKIGLEIQEVIGERDLEFNDIANLEYTKAFISEVLRLRAIAPMISSENLSATEIMGVKFPAKSTFLLLTRVDSFKNQFFSNATEFSPERWLKSSKMPNHCPRASMPFGGGARLCAGNKLAVIEIVSLLVALCRNYELSNDLNKGVEIKETYAFLMAPEFFKVKLTPKKQNLTKYPPTH